jgi:hypothetical protein
MANLKHVGRIKTNKRRVIVAYRTVPNEPYNALVVPTESLPADEHDALIRLVESATGQQAYELAEAMFRSTLPDGRNMLTSFHASGQLRKVATKDIEMTPDHVTSIGLDQLNEVIAQQKGVSVADLALTPTETKDVERVAREKAAKEKAISEAETVGDDDPVVIAMKAANSVALDEAVVVANVAPLTNAELAMQLIRQAETMLTEAKALQAKAEELAPTPKKTTPRRTPTAKKKESV